MGNGKNHRNHATYSRYHPLNVTCIYTILVVMRSRYIVDCEASLLYTAIDKASTRHIASSTSSFRTAVCFDAVADLCVKPFCVPFVFIRTKPKLPLESIIFRFHFAGITFVVYALASGSVGPPFRRTYCVCLYAITTNKKNSPRFFDVASFTLSLPVYECAVRVYIFAANTKFINWMLYIRNCEAFEHYNGDLTQLFIIVAFQWLSLSLCFYRYKRTHEKTMLAHEVDIAAVVCGTDFEIESYRYIFYVWLWVRVAVSIRNEPIHKDMAMATAATLNAFVAKEIAKPIWYISLSIFLTLSFILRCNLISFSLHFLSIQFRAKGTHRPGPRTIERGRYYLI